MIRITLSLFLLMTFHYWSQAATIITNPVFPKVNYTTYEKAEASFNITFDGGNYSNPYDSSIVSVDAIVTLPNNSTITIPCFYFYPTTFYSSTTVNWWEATENSGSAKWMLRYAPKTTGTHTISIRVIDANGTATSLPVTIIVASGSNKGFVRIDGTNNQFMRFDNNAPYYPVGENLAWATPGTLVNFYNTYLGNLGNNKATWIRYWLTGFARQALEWQPTHWSGWYGGLGKYSQRASALLDSVVNNCERKGIYMQLVLQQHGQFSEVVDANWSENPYNSANAGGIITNPCSFFNDLSAMARTKMQYRYIVARWGYSSNILAWELFNEVNFAGTNNAGQLAPCSQTDVTTWHNTMSNYLKSIDVNKHLVTSSTGSAGHPLLSAMDGNNTSLDMLQYHAYPGAPVEKSMTDNAISAKATYSKPVLCGEFGIGGTTQSSIAGDLWGDHIRKPLWTGMFNEVPAMYWYWDSTYMQKKNLYNVFKPLSTFLEGVDLVGETGGHSNEIKFALNPSYSGTVKAVPGMNWGNSTQQDFVVDAAGNIAGLQNLSSYLAGQSWHAGMGNYASFTVNYASAGTATINILASNTPPNNVEIFVDGVSVINSNFSAAGSLSASVPAGIHIIKFQMNGLDWVNVSSYDFTIAAQRCLAYGYHGTTTAYGYVYDKSASQWQDPSTATAISTAQIKIGSLTNGNYQVDYFDPQAGTAFYSGGVYATVNDSITIPLPSFKKDIAFKVSATTSSPTSILGHHSKPSDRIYLYPNPAGNEVKLEMYSLKECTGTISIYNTLGEQKLSQVVDLTEGPNLITLDISSLPPALYVIHIENKGKAKLRFVKK
jgi:hypothetical protein